MNRYATSWTLAHRQSCEATKVYGEQSTETLDLRMACLRRLNNNFSSLSELYANANREVAARSLAMVGELQDVSLCSDLKYLEARGKLPADAATRQRIEDVERDLASVEALESAGSYKQAMSNAIVLVGQATELGHKATLAEVLFVRGRIAGSLGELAAATNDLDNALLAAEASAHQALRVEISLELARTTGTRGAKVDAGMQLAKQAYAIAEGQGSHTQWIGEALLLQAQLWQTRGNYAQAEAALTEARGVVDASPQHLPLLRASLAMFRGKLSYAHGNLAEAETYYQQARAGMEETLGKSHPLVASALVNLGSLAKDRQDAEKALALYESAKELFTQSLGPEHVRVAQVLGNIALVHTEYGPLEQALDEHRQSLEILQRELGDNHRSVGLQLNNVGLALVYLGRGLEAIPYFEKAKEVFAAIDENHERISIADSNLGLAYRNLNKLELARKHYTLALDRLVASHGTSNPDVASRLSDLAIIAIIREEYDAAVPLLTRAIEAFRESGAPASYVAINLLDLGWVQVQRGHFDAAKQHLIDADRIFEEIDSTNYYRHGSAKFELAKLLWATPKERTRARELAHSAHTLFKLAGEEMAAEAVEIEAWLRTHKAPRA
jgi:tetratricopeptide (TPR) repeat protein